MRLFKRLLTMLILIALITGALTVYLNTFVIPKKLPRFLEQTLSAQLHRHVSIRSVRFIPFNGLAVHGLAISAPEDPAVPFMRAEKISGSVLLFSLLKERKIIIPRIVIERPQITVIRTKEGSFNFSDLLTPREQRGPSPAGNVLISGIQITDGTVIYRDSAVPVPVSTSVTDLSLGIKLADLTRIAFSLRGTLDGAGQFKGNGELNLATKHYSGTVSLDRFNPSLLIKLFAPASLPPIALGALTGTIGLDGTTKQATITPRIGIEDLSVPIGTIGIRASAHTDLTLTMDLTGEHPLQYQGTVTLDSGRAENVPGLGTIALIPAPAGTKNSFTVHNDLFSADLSVNALERPCAVQIRSQTRPAPSLSLSLEAPDIRLNANTALQATGLRQASGTGTVCGTTFSLTADIEDPLTLLSQVTGSLKIDLSRLKTLPAPLISPQTRASLEQMAPSGIITIDLSAYGSPRRLQDLQAQAMIQAPSVTLSRTTLTDLTATMLCVGGKISVSSAQALLYGGTARLAATVNCTVPNPAYNFDVAIDRVDLKRYFDTTPLRDKEISGILNLTVTGGGFGTNLETLRGRAGLSVTDADLGPLPILNPALRNLLTGIKGFQKGYDQIKIRQGRGSFAIANRAVYTEDLRFWGDLAVMEYRGTVDFAGNLDITVQNSFTQAPEEKTDLGSFLSNIATLTSAVAGTAHIGGTFEKPVFEFQISPENILEKLFQ